MSGNDRSTALRKKLLAGVSTLALAAALGAAMLAGDARATCEPAGNNVNLTHTCAGAGDNTPFDALGGGDV